jgi:hypothetical protein
VVLRLVRLLDMVAGIKSDTSTPIDRFTQPAGHLQD